MKLPKGFSYEKGLNKDAEAIKNVIFTTLIEYGLPIDPNATDSDLDQPEDFYKDGFFGVIKNEAGEIVGTFGLLEYQKGIVEIRKMYLLKACRGKGIGKFMMNFLMEKAKEMTYEKVMLETATALKEAIVMYEKYGFELKKEAPHTNRCDRMYFKDL
ncbi:MAG: putative acetyltransferase [Maribacter sp.]|jgi:putative acetyltransferase